MLILKNQFPFEMYVLWGELRFFKIIINYRALIRFSNICNKKFLDFPQKRSRARFIFEQLPRYSNLNCTNFYGEEINFITIRNDFFLMESFEKPRLYL